MWLILATTRVTPPKSKVRRWRNMIPVDISIKNMHIGPFSLSRYSSRLLYEYEWYCGGMPSAPACCAAWLIRMEIPDTTQIHFYFMNMLTLPLVKPLRHFTVVDGKMVTHILSSYRATVTRLSRKCSYLVENYERRNSRKTNY